MDENNSELIKLLNSKKNFKYDGNKITLTIKQSIEKAGKRGKSLIERVKYDNKILSLQTPINPFYRFKPIFVTCDKGTSDRNLGIVVEALEEVLNSINMKEILPIHSFGYWNEGNEPHQSIDWYIKRSFNPERKNYDISNNGQCDLYVFWKDLKEDPIQNERPHYEVILLSDFDLYDRLYGYRFMIGEGGDQGAIISIKRYKNSGREIIKQAALHEFGHAFASLNHCGDVRDGKEGECTMKFPNKIPTDLEIQAKYRTREGILFCNKHELKSYGLNKQFNRKHSIHFPEVKEIKNKIYSLNPRLLKVLDSGKLTLLETKIILD